MIKLGIYSMVIAVINSGPRARFKSITTARTNLINSVLVCFELMFVASEYSVNSVWSLIDLEVRSSAWVRPALTHFAVVSAGLEVWGNLLETKPEFAGFPPAVFEQDSDCWKGWFLFSSGSNLYLVEAVCLGLEQSERQWVSFSVCLYFTQVQVPQPPHQEMYKYLVSRVAQ